MLVGRAFYESLGSPRLIVAPMVDQSEFAWRLLTRSFFPVESRPSVLSYSPMLHARMLSEDVRYRDRMFEPLRYSIPTPPSTGLQSFPDDSLRFDGNPKFDRPFFVQFCANDPKHLLAAAKYVQPFCDAVDLNLGCPQGIAKKGHYGAFLQEDWSLIHKLISTLKDELSIPVTAKFRIQETKERTLEYAKMMLSAGASILAVHGRTREQKGHNTGLADWSVIRYLRDNLPPETVIFANGNILQHEDIEACLKATGADGIMSAEGNLSDPSLFAPPPPAADQSREYWRGRDGKGGYRMDAVLRRYLDIIWSYVMEKDPPQRKPLFVVEKADLEEQTSPEQSSEGAQAQNKRQAQEEPSENGAGGVPTKKQKRLERKQEKNRGPRPARPSSPNLLAMQAHFFNMLRPLVSKHTHVRDALARSNAGDLDSYEHVLQLVEDVTKQGMIDYEKGLDDGIFVKHPKTGSDQAVSTAEPGQSSEEAVARCRRPWWVCQPYVRPLPSEAIKNGAMTLSKKEKAKLDAEQKVAAQSGVMANGSSHLESVNANPDDKVEVPADALVCG